ncbi:MAG: twin-arginine translocation signal domain-containing protein [Gemmatimonadetes bacterium]|nr:twin-arginine translocation signal domain-containing protein [Gemmatimonadota bacterium]NNL31421.1 twin-arginine translocation signal domain-containing protein [Gemmatimonadota bacterium]
MSDGSDRRTFLKQGFAITAAAATTGAIPKDSSARPQVAPDPALLRALAELVLPSELGADGREAAVVAFEDWLELYEPAFEVNHGYGTHEIVYGPADPGPGWQAQLEAMDVEARRRAGTGFSELPPGERRALVERQLAGEGGGLPAPARARHVAVGLLAHWATSSEAHDLAYRARIRRHACRGLDDLGEPPPPLAGDEA